MKIFKILGLAVAFCCIFSKGLYSSEIDSSAMKDKTSSQAFSVFIGGNYGTNYLYYGSTFSDNKPFYSSDFSIMHKSGFWGSASVYHISNETPYINFYDINFGWQKEVTPWFDAGVSYTRFVFPKVNNDGSSVGFNFWSFQAGLDWNFLYTSVSGSFLSGDQTDFYLIMKNSHYFQTPKIAKTELYISFDPSFTFVAGSRDYYKVTLIRRQPGRWPGRIIVEEERSFQILDFELNLPAALNWRKFTLEPSVIYYHPVNQSYNDLSREGFYFYLSFYISL